MTLAVAGQPQALLAFLRDLDGLAPRVRTRRLGLEKRSQGGYTAEIDIELLERVAVPPPAVPPPAQPSIPLEPEPAVRALRAYILRIDKATQEAQSTLERLRTASSEVGGVDTPAAGPMAALFPKGSTALISATIEDDAFRAVAEASVEAEALEWAAAVGDHPSVAQGLVSSVATDRKASGRWTHRVEVAGERRRNSP